MTAKRIVFLGSSHFGNKNIYTLRFFVETNEPYVFLTYSLSKLQNTIKAFKTRGSTEFDDIAVVDMGDGRIFLRNYKIPLDAVKKLAESK